MIPIFTRPLELVTAADVEDLVAQAWPEGYDVEYKKPLPHKKGGDDPWIEGKNEIGEYARDEVLAEVVALANAQGGTVILGIEETADKPPRANSINALPRVREIARRLEDQARSCIDPPLPRLQIRGIDIDANDRGVVILRTIASREAPHRLATTREGYARRGASTVRMTMREIQDMTLNVARGVAGIEKIYDARRTGFTDWGRRSDVSVGFRVTAVPLTPMPDVGRIFDRRELYPHVRTIKATIGKVAIDLGLFIGDTSERPIVRGVACSGDNGRSGYRCELHQEGMVDLWFNSRPHKNIANAPAEQIGMKLYHSWVLGGLANVLLIVDKHRAATGAPDIEYGIEVEIARFPEAGSTPITYGGLSDTYSSDRYALTDLPVIFPRLSVGARSEFQALINIVNTDIYDFLGSRLKVGEPIQPQWP